MFETLASFLLVKHMATATFKDTPQNFGYERMLMPRRRPLKTEDCLITILTYSNAQWARFFTASDRKGMLDHPWVTTIDESNADIGGIYDMVALMME